MAYVSLLIGVTITLLVVSFFLYRKNQVEGFATQAYNTNNLEIKTCPLDTIQMNTVKGGTTDCCRGNERDGKCDAKISCTISPYNKERPDVPTCIDYWRNHFKTKGIEFCPATMPNYFEDVTNAQSTKGCSASGIVTLGKEPIDGTKRKCRVYASEADNRNKADSCYVEKERLKIQCPVVKGKSPQATAKIDNRTNMFLYYTCDYPAEPGLASVCYEEKTIKKYYDNTQPNWRTQKFQAVEDELCKNFIARRNRQEEDKRRISELEKALKVLEEKFSWLWGLFKKRK